MKQKAYARAGVDIDLGNRVKATLPQLLASTHRREVLGKVGGFGGLFALEGGLILDLLLEDAGVEGLEALGPIVLAGPVLHRPEAFAEFIGDGLKPAGVA